MRRAPLLALLLAATGCAVPVPAPEGDVDRRAVYQRIANVLPEGHFGWGTPPALVEMAASTRAEGPAPKPPALTCDERGFRVMLHVYRPRGMWVPYGAIEEVRDGWSPLPNVLLVPFLVLPLQARRVTLVVDAAQVHGFSDAIERDTARLESISREIGLGGPWAFAQSVKGEVAAAEAEFGRGRIAIHFDFMVPIPAVIPWRGDDWRAAEAFAWAAANPTAPRLDEEPESR